MTDRRVLVCDDDVVRGQAWADRIQKTVANEDGMSVSAVPPHEFAAALLGLEGRRIRARDVGPESVLPVSPEDVAASKRLDTADILIVDYDLTPDKDRSPDPTDDNSAVEVLTGKSGEDFIYLARYFASPKAVVVVNQEVQAKTFDLTLQRFSNSLADVNVTAHDIGRESLWFGTGGGFAPWSWPQLATLPNRIEARIGLIKDLDQPVLEALQLSDDDHFYSFTQGQLDPLGAEPRATSFRVMAEQSRLGPKGHDRRLLSDDGLARRVAAVVVSRWLECLVVPAQNVLVDAPHLAQRFPAIVVDDRTEAAVWNSIVASNGALNDEALATAATQATAWTARDVWSLPKAAEAARALGRVPSQPGSVFVFCEDTSRFVEISSAVEFESGVQGPYVQRFVEKLEEIDYSPRGRLR